ncbi:MAG: ABC transporter substrate-binding protein [Myxococcota bacterium]
MNIYCKGLKFLPVILIFPIIASSDVVYPLKGLRFEGKSDLRIISTAPSITETLYFLGLFENVVGLTRYDDFPEGVGDKEIIGGYLDIDVEKIMRLEPDIVFCEPNSGIKSSVELLANRGIPIYVVNVNSILDILFSIEEIGRIMGRANEGRRVLNELYERYIHLQRLISKRKSSALIILNENPMMVAGKNSFVGELLNLSGLRNIYDGEYKYPVLDNEVLIRLKPDMVINISESVMMGKERKNDISGAFRLFLNESTKIYNISDPVFIRPSPRFIDAIEKLCTLNSEYYCY